MLSLKRVLLIGALAALPAVGAGVAMWLLLAVLFDLSNQVAFISTLLTDSLAWGFIWYRMLDHAVKLRQTMIIAAIFAILKISLGLFGALVIAYVIGFVVWLAGSYMIVQRRSSKDVGTMNV
jgi:hypothetical protein